MASVFTQIITGEEPGFIVWRDDLCVAFMDNDPLTDGHVLVVPVDEVDHWADLDSVTQRHLFEVVSRVGKAIDAVFDCRRVGVMIIGYEVPHTHVHVFPTNSMGDFSFSQKQGSSDPADLKANSERIRAVLER